MRDPYGREVPRGVLRGEAVVLDGDRSRWTILRRGRDLEGRLLVLAVPEGSPARPGPALGGVSWPLGMREIEVRE